jgi:hypothetical protein
MDADRPPIIVAHNHHIGHYYAKQFGEPRAKIVTEAHGLMGYSPGPRCPQIIVINSDDDRSFNQGVVEQLRWLEHIGIEIDWLG